MGGRIRGAAAGSVAAIILAACSEAPPPPRSALRVGVEVTAVTDYAPEIALTGEVAARVSSELSFRVGGRVLERRAEVGDRVAASQVLAVLDPEEQRANVTASEADVASAEAKVRQTTSTFERQKALIAQGFTTRRDYDQAEQELRTSQGSLEGARAQLGTARDGLDQTVLRPDAAGIITARSVEGGQVVQSAQTVYTLAQDGPRDAVFFVYESIFVREPSAPTIEVALVADPAVRALARIREVSPAVDTATGTVRVKFDIIDPPVGMTLGAAVVGRGRFTPERRIGLSWNVLSSRDGKPAVWIVDAGTKAVSLRPITIEAYDVERIVVRDGLDDGQMVVTRGQHLLHPGQVVEPVAEGAT